MNPESQRDDSYTGNLYQTLDVSLNRLREGMRVLSEIVRFSPEAFDGRDQRSRTSHGKLYAKISALRRKIGLLEKKVFDLHPEIIYYRKVRKDPGSPISDGARIKREILRHAETGRSGKAEGVQLERGFLSILERNLNRTEEALRVVEELLRTQGDERLSREYSRLRFETYELEKELSVTEKNINRRFRFQETLKKTIFYVILDDSFLPMSPAARAGITGLITIAKDLSGAGVRIFQLRSKSLPTRHLLEIGRELVNLKKRCKDLTLIINDRADLVSALDADGLHIGQDDIPIQTARELLPHKLIGVTVRSPSAAQRAERGGADYLAVGSIFASPTKPEAKVVGLETLREIRSVTSLPIVAIGGITYQRIASVLKSGADGVAGISAIRDDPDRLRNLKRLINERNNKSKNKRRGERGLSRD